MSSKRLGSIDFAKFIFSVMIVGLHTNVFSDFSSDLAFLVNQIIARLAVPFFFIASGYFIGKRVIEKNKTDFYKNYFFRYIKLFLLFCLIYSPITFYWAFNNDNSIFLNLVLYIQQLIFLAPAYLWFLLALAFGVIILKYLVKVPLYLGILIIIILYTIGVFGNSYIFFFDNESVLINEYFRIFLTTRNGLFFAVPFMYMGYLISIKAMLIIKRNVVVLFVVTFIIYVFEVYFVHTKTLLPNEDTSMYFMLLPASFLLFIILVKIKIRSSKLLIELADFSLYLYVFQFGFISIVLVLNRYIINSVMYIYPTLTFLITLIGSFCLYKFYKNIFYKRRKLK